MLEQYTENVKGRCAT